MKSRLSVIATILTITVLHAICLADDKREERPRFKGVELYSWRDKENHWVFVMLDGTNRLKSEEEVKGAKDQIKGAADLKKAMARLAVGEQVFWTHLIKGFEFPSEAMRKELQDAATKAKICLDITTTEPER